MNQYNFSIITLILFPIYPVSELIHIAETCDNRADLQFCYLKDFGEYTTPRILPLFGFALSPHFLNLLSMFLSFSVQAWKICLI